MRVFVLSTGRCGSTTFARACRHIENYTAAHESRSGRVGPERLAYPDDHIEVDNRLSWFLGRLGEAFPDAFYVHLRRDPEATAHSFKKRLDEGLILRAYMRGIILSEVPETGLAESTLAENAYESALDYVHTVNANIAWFLRDRAHMVMDIEDCRSEFRELWRRINARGDIEAALAEFDVLHNASRRAQENQEHR